MSGSDATDQPGRADFLAILRLCPAHLHLRQWRAEDRRPFLPMFRASGPVKSPHFDNAVAHVDCPDRRIGRLCITCCSPFEPSHHAPIVPGTAAFLTSTPDLAPTALLHNLKHNNILHE
jgi:hypothetical protein